MQKFSYAQRRRRRLYANTAAGSGESRTSAGSFPNSRTELAALAASQEVAAHERRAGLISQLHKQAITAADDMSAWQGIIKGAYP